jgi:hypothetical protein
MVKHKEYYKEKGGGFPQAPAMVNLVSSGLPVAHPCTKSAPTIVMTFFILHFKIREF